MLILAGPARLIGVKFSDWVREFSVLLDVLDLRNY
jgi:hypothetical protein